MFSCLEIISKSVSGIVRKGYRGARRASTQRSEHGTRIEAYYRRFAVYLSVSLPVRVSLRCIPWNVIVTYLKFSPMMYLFYCVTRNTVMHRFVPTNLMSGQLWCKFFFSLFVLSLPILLTRNRPFVTSTLNIVLRLIAILDQVEMRVERLRRDTVRIEEERDSLLSTLDSIKHSELLGDVTECKYLWRLNGALRQGRNNHVATVAKASSPFDSR